MVELTVSGKVGLAWDAYRGGVGDVMDGIRGSTKDALSRILGRKYIHARLTRYHSWPIWTSTVSIRMSEGIRRGDSLRGSLQQPCRPLR
jgi:hypothetical protein